MPSTRLVHLLVYPRLPPLNMGCAGGHVVHRGHDHDAHHPARPAALRAAAGGRRCAGWQGRRGRMRGSLRETNQKGLPATSVGGCATTS